MKLIDLLIHMLTYLEKVNAITYWSRGGSINKIAEGKVEEMDGSDTTPQKDEKQNHVIQGAVHTYIHVCL